MLKVERKVLDKNTRENLPEFHTAEAKTIRFVKKHNKNPFLTLQIFLTYL